MGVGHCSRLLVSVAVTCALAGACFPAMTFRDDARDAAGGGDAAQGADDGAPGSAASDAGDGSSASDGGGFPVTPVLDRFDRADGDVGPSWTDVANFVVSGGQLVAHPVSGSSYAYWNGATFGQRQEVYVTFAPGTAGMNTRLLLHADSRATGSCIGFDQFVAVSYDGSSNVGVDVCDIPDGGAVTQAVIGSGSATYAPGDRFGARILEDGRVLVYRNGDVVLTVQLPLGGPRNAAGHIGILAYGEGARYDDFGGGTLP